MPRASLSANDPDDAVPPRVVAMCAAQACAQIGAVSVVAVVPTLISVWTLTNTDAGWISGIYAANYQ